MAQTGFPLFLDGHTITVRNDSTTTAITAGDLLCCGTVNDVIATTSGQERSSYSAGDIKVKAVKWANTNYKTFVGVALTDIAADGYGSMAMEGIFIHQTKTDTEAGDHIMAAATTGNKVECIKDQGTTLLLTDGHYEIGKALTGGSADGKYIIWKLTY